VDPQPVRAPRIPRRLLLVGWLVLATFFIVRNVIVAAPRGQPVDWQWYVFHEALYWLVWAAFAPLVFAWAGRFRIERGVGPAPIAAHLGLMAVAGPAQITATYALHLLAIVATGVLPAADMGSWFADRGRAIVWLSLTNYGYYWLLVGAYYAFDYSRKYRAQKLESAELEARLSRAQLDTLRAQLHPHFLFNTLNSVAVLALEEPEKANAMIRRLSELLRITLDSAGRHEVTLAEELHTLQHYLAIQQVRLEERLNVEMDIDPGTLDVPVPTLILQPIVENAIRHGIDPRVDGGTVTVRTAREGDRLVLQVTNDGRGLTTGEGREGIGLGNTRARLAELYGASQRLHFREVPDGGLTVTIELPFSTAPQHDEHDSRADR